MPPQNCAERRLRWLNRCSKATGEARNRRARSLSFGNPSQKKRSIVAGAINDFYGVWQQIRHREQPTLDAIEDIEVLDGVVDELVGERVETSGVGP